VGAVGVLAITFLVVVVTLGLHQAGVIPSLTGPSWNRLLPIYNFVTTILFYGAMLGAVLLFAARGGLRRAWRELGLARPPYWVIPLMVPLAVGLQLLTGVVSTLLSPLLGGMTNPQGCDISTGFGGDPVLGIVAIVVIAPVVEEITFRGFIYGGLRTRLSTSWAVVVSSLVFAVAHSLSVGGSILLLGPSLFIAGAALALVYQRTRSLYPGMALHASFNLIAVILIFLSSTAANCHAIIR
jgi:membrane protease YdiL (CAAX protease family)